MGWVVILVGVLIVAAGIVFSAELGVMGWVAVVCVGVLLLLLGTVIAVMRRL